MVDPWLIQAPVLHPGVGVPTTGLGEASNPGSHAGRAEERVEMRQWPVAKRRDRNMVLQESAT